MSIPIILPRKLLACFLGAICGIIYRVGELYFSWSVGVVGELTIYALAMFSGALLLAWAAEGAEKYISTKLVIILLALITVLPEYVVDIYFAWRAGSDTNYTAYAAANMTGANRLLLGLGWPLVILISYSIWKFPSLIHKQHKPKNYEILPKSMGVEIVFLGFLAILALFPLLVHAIPLWFGILLIALFFYYIFKVSKTETETCESVSKTAAALNQIAAPKRKLLIISMFGIALVSILFITKPFATALINTGNYLGINNYLLIQWLAPIVSEAPEFILAILFALKGNSATSLGILLAAKINHWSLLVGSLPVVYFLSGKSTQLPLDSRQIVEIALTISQTILAFCIIFRLRAKLSQMLILGMLFVSQIFITSTEGRTMIIVLQLITALIIFIANSRSSEIINASKNLEKV